MRATGVFVGFWLVTLWATEAGEFRLLTAEPVIDSATVVLAFSANVDPMAASNSACFAIRPGVVISNSFVSALNTNTVTLRTSPLFSGGTYNLTVTGLADTAGNVIGTNEIQFQEWVFLPGFLRREYYKNIPGYYLSNLTNSLKFPSQPDSVDFINSFETVQPFTNLGFRVSGVIVPSADSTNFFFCVSSYTQAALYLSSDASPANRRQIAFNPSWSNSRHWWYDGDGIPPGGTPNISEPASLFAGQSYYIELVVKSDVYGSHGEVNVSTNTPRRRGSPLNGTLSADNINFGTYIHPREILFSL